MDQRKLIKFLGLWIASSIILLIASVIFGSNVVLGNDKLSVSLAAVLSGFIISGLTHLVPKAVEKFDYKVKKDNIWLVIFFAANVIIIWLIKRFALVTGLGISNNLYVVLIAAAVALVHWKAERVVDLFSKK